MAKKKSLASSRPPGTSPTSLPTLSNVEGGGRQRDDEKEAVPEKKKKKEEHWIYACSPLTVSMYVIVIVLTIIFVQQAVIAVRKYLKFEVVEDVSVERRLEATMPPLTFCMVPAYKKPLDPMAMQQFDGLGCSDAEDIRACVEAISFNLEELVLTTFRYPGVLAASEPDLVTNWHNSTTSMAMGSCFTHRVMEPERYSQAFSDFILFDLSNPFLSGGYSLFVFIHNEDTFIPSYGMSAEFVGQKSMTITPQPAGILQINADVTHRIHLSTDEYPCVEDKDYRVVRCMEDFVSGEVGCASPWNMYKSDKYEDCKTKEQFNATYALHMAIFTYGAPQFEDLTGCRPPCEYDDFDFTTRSFENPHVTGVFGGDAVSGLAITLRSTNLKVVKEAWLYQLHNLVGEVGGCLGMFLGVSLVSLYQMTLGAMQTAFKYARID